MEKSCCRFCEIPETSEINLEFLGGIPGELTEKTIKVKMVVK
jgi:hypothetical protein